jgi:hypothetical protein
LRGQSFQFKLVANSVMGGLASVAGGGNFANGATTAAFGYLFNEVGLACRGAVGSPWPHCGLFVYRGYDDGSADMIAQFSFAGKSERFNEGLITYAYDRETFWQQMPTGGDPLFRQPAFSTIGSGDWDQTAAHSDRAMA